MSYDDRKLVGLLSLGVSATQPLIMSTGHSSTGIRQFLNALYGNKYEYQDNLNHFALVKAGKGKVERCYDIFTHASGVAVIQHLW